MFEEEFVDCWKALVETVRLLVPLLEDWKLGEDPDDDWKLVEERLLVPMYEDVDGIAD